MTRGRSVGMRASLRAPGAGRNKTRTTAISIPQISRSAGQDVFIRIIPSMESEHTFTLENVFLCSLPNYDEVQALSMAQPGRSDGVLFSSGEKRGFCSKTMFLVGKYVLAYRHKRVIRAT